MGRKNSGYRGVTLYAINKSKTYLVHRLVAEVFIPNPDNLPCVNHKDENPLNNRVDNLEWCTYSYNNSYGTRNERIGNSNKGKPRLKGKENSNYGKHPSKETREKMKKAKEGKYNGKNNPNYGKKASAETRVKQSVSQKARFEREGKQMLIENAKKCESEVGKICTATAT